MNALARALDKWGNDIARRYHLRMMPVWRAQAAFKRRRLVKNYVAVIGSCGKSTTTMLTGRLISEQASTKVGCFDNTQRDCLRVVRRITQPVDFVVQEVTEWRLGTQAHVSRTMHPDCAIVTSVGLDHLTAFRTVEAVAAELETLTRHCRILCLNADNAAALTLSRSATGRVIRFGVNPDAEVRAINVVSALPHRLEFDLLIDGVTRHVKTRFLGTLMLTNVLGALACVHAHGLDLDKAIATLATIEPAKGRMSVHGARGGSTVLLDTVKAPLWSARLLVSDLPNMNKGSRVFLLGALSDTGSGGSSVRYRQVLTAALEVCDLVIGFGESQGSALRLAERHGADRIMAAQNLKEAVRLLEGRAPDLIIVKGNGLNRESQDNVFLTAMQA